MIFNPEHSTPKYVNCKHGFLKLESNKAFAGFTANMRVATPLYMSNAAAIDVAKRALQQASKDWGYFVIVEPTLIGFVKGGV